MSEALVTRRDTPAALINLALALHGKDDLDGAIFTLTPIQLHPGLPEAHANIALILKDAGRLDERSSTPAERCRCTRLPSRRFAVDVDSVSPRVRSSRDRPGAVRLVPTVHTGAHPSGCRPPQRLSADRRLRVGYVSPDFRAHPVGYNVLTLLDQHDHDQFEIFCYSNVARPDTLTDRFRQCADQWRDIRPLSDDQAAEMVRRDRIDILVDLALHTGENRLALFAEAWPRFR